MAMRTAQIRITGVSPLLQNNPQTVDRFNRFAKRMAAINAKKTRRTDDDFLELRDLEMEAKVYFDPDIGVYVPSPWLHEAIATAAFKVAKLSRADKKLVRALKLSRNTPRPAAQHHDQTEARILMKRSGIRQAA